MLIGIPSILSPELIKVLSEMGHGDEICIGDGNFPAESIGAESRVIRADGHGIPEILEAILKVIPLDSYVDHPVVLMQVVPGDTVLTPIWETYKNIVSKYDSRGAASFENIEKFSFYARAKTCYATIATSEAALYANIILKKGVIIED